MNYELLYKTIITKYGSTYRQKGEYKERHHILPKCLGGKDEAINLVYLPARVHYICHRLLCKVYPSNNQLKFAFWAMSNQLTGDVNRTYKISSHVYNKARQEFSIANSALHKGKKMSKEYCEALSKRMMGNTVNPKGKDNPLYGIPRSEDIKAKIRATIKANKTNSKCFKGYWVTPYGKFESTAEATIAHPTINNPTSIRNFCKNSSKIVTLKMTYKGPFTELDIGKSLSELGWGFEPTVHQSVSHN